MQQTPPSSDLHFQDHFQSPSHHAPAQPPQPPASPTTKPPVTGKGVTCVVDAVDGCFDLEASTHLLKGHAKHNGGDPHLECALQVSSRLDAPD